MSKALLINLMAAFGLSACGGARTREMQAPDPAPVPVSAPARSLGDTEAITGCVFAVHYPHRSHHNPSRVNVVSRIQCDRVMPLIAIQLGLMYNGEELIRQPFTKVNSEWFEVQVDVPCENGVYNGDATAQVTFPPPAFPPIGYVHAGSGDVTVSNCP